MEVARFAGEGLVERLAGEWRAWEYASNKNVYNDSRRGTEADRSQWESKLAGLLYHAGLFFAMG
jgi:hypothetical protein